MDKQRKLTHLGERSWTYWYQKDWTTNPDPGIATTGSARPVVSIEKTSTSGHAWPSAGPALTDVGGNFTTIKVNSITNSDDSINYGASHGWKYVGQEMAVNPQWAIDECMPYILPTSDYILGQKGSTAIARTIPTNPVADAGTFIGELKSGLPKLVGKELFKTKFKDYRKVGSEYLNVEFGWKPLISDLQKFGKAAIESEKIIEQLHRDSGRNIRRKYTFPDESSSEKFVTSGGYQSYCNGVSVYPYCFKSVTGAPLTVETKVETKTWFSGCFTYHVNLGNTLPDRIARHAAEARKLFGVELTPATVWNLAPWSWAVDWEGNIGDVLHNVSRFSQDGLVLRYGYIMQSKTVTRTYTLPHSGRLYRSPDAPLVLTIVANSKVRRAATPFGFGFDMTALTGRQSAILGALGIARGPRR